MRLSAAQHHQLAQYAEALCREAAALAAAQLTEEAAGRPGAVLAWLG